MQKDPVAASFLLASWGPAQQPLVLGIALLGGASLLQLVWPCWNRCVTVGLDFKSSCASPTGQEERRCNRILLHTFIQSYFFFLYISPLFISPLFLYLPCLYLPIITILSRIIILPLTRASHSYILSVPIHAQQATPPHQARSFS